MKGGKLPRWIPRWLRWFALILRWARRGDGAPIYLLQRRLVWRARRRNGACALIVGAIVFVFWAWWQFIETADHDAVEAANTMNGLFSDLRELQQDITRKNVELALMEARRGDMENIQHQAEEKLAEILRDDPNAPTHKTRDARGLIDEMGSRIETRDREIGELRTQLGVLETRESELRKQIEDTALHPPATPEASVPIVFSLGSKISVTVVLLFSVQMLVAAFRYNTNLAVFYRARADEAGLLANASADTIETWAGTLYPKHINYDRVRTPVETLAGAVGKADIKP